ncbi:MAG: class I SAM-dependent methyltransferase [Proteobacteria bacterium]|nr:class I SAM-dependent methyltransferase [Pseudomonadota bacterium]
MRKIILALLALSLSGLTLAQTAGAGHSERLASVLAAQPDEVQARYKYRHPQETLEFFGIEPGMTVVEALPGGGWYTRILLPYLGAGGQLIGADYALEMWPNFEFVTDEFFEERKTWVQDWMADAEEWRTDDSAEISAFVLGSVPESMHGTADAVLFIRALHNMARFESNGKFLTAAIRDSYDVLKPGGIVGIVQHHARDTMPDKWADGEMGYLKKGYVIEMMEAAGFELVGDSDMHANNKDQPTNEEFVWRLPPSYDGSRDNPELKAKMDAIGESNRMTLKFRKP